MGVDESDDNDRFAEEDGRGWMGRLMPLRDELGNCPPVNVWRPHLERHHAKLEVHAQQQRQASSSRGGVATGKGGA